MVARALILLTLSAGLMTGLTACGEGAKTDCSTSQCTVTFDRSVADANVNILGAEVVLVNATAEAVTLKVAGQEVTVNTSASTTAAGLTITLKSVTDTDVVIEVSRA